MTLERDVVPALGLTDAEYKFVVKAGLTSLLTRQSSWLERLFLQKCHEVYPDLVDAQHGLTFRRDDAELTTDTFGVVGNVRLCTHRMSDYLRTLLAYTGNACLWEYTWGEDAHCTADHSINTWSVRNQRAAGRGSSVSFPGDTAHNLRAWRAYFRGNRVWDDGGLHELLNLYWRNTLIPAHEVVHLFATQQHKFAQSVETRACERDMSDDDLLRRRRVFDPAFRRGRTRAPPRSTRDPPRDPPRDPLRDSHLGDAYHDEWTASVANANIFILHMRQHYRESDQPRHRAIYQLHVVHGMLYIVALLRRIRRAVGALPNADERASAGHMLELGVRWTLLSIDDAEGRSSVVRCVTTCGWTNTYLKHISALMYAINFFQADDSAEFVNSILTADIWYSDVYDAYKRRTIRLCLWEGACAPRPVAGWILERPGALVHTATSADGRHRSACDVRSKTHVRR